MLGLGSTLTVPIGVWAQVSGQERMLLDEISRLRAEVERLKQDPPREVPQSPLDMAAVHRELEALRGSISSLQVGRAEPSPMPSSLSGESVGGGDFGAGWSRESSTAAGS